MWTQDHSWRTNFPPPYSFFGHEYGDYGDEDYNRQCTPEECAILDRRFPDVIVDEPEEPRHADEAECAAFFAALAELPVDENLPGEVGEGERPRASGDGGGASTVSADDHSASPLDCPLPTESP